MECPICKVGIDSALIDIVGHLAQDHDYDSIHIIALLFEEIEKLKAELLVLKEVVYGNKKPGS